MIFVRSENVTVFYTQIYYFRSRKVEKPEIKARWTSRQRVINIYIFFFFFSFGPASTAGVSLIFFYPFAGIESRRASNENPFCAVPLRLRIEGVVASSPPLRFQSNPFIR